MSLKPRKRSNKTLSSFLRVYDADTDEIVNLWFSERYALKCPIMRQCMECKRCRVLRE